MRRPGLRLLLAPWLLLASLQAAAGEAGYLTRDVELKAEPAQGAPVVGRLAKDTDVEVLAEQRAWAHVKSGATSGWMLAFYVMKGQRAAPTGLGKRLSEVWSLGTERSAATSSTIGVRGLDEEDLRSARFDEQALERLDAAALPADEATRFAKEGGLVPRRLDYFPAPQPVASQSESQPAQY